MNNIIGTVGILGAKLYILAEKSEGKSYFISLELG